MLDTNDFTIPDEKGTEVAVGLDFTIANHAFTTGLVGLLRLQDSWLVHRMGWHSAGALNINQRAQGAKRCLYIHTVV